MKNLNFLVNFFENFQKSHNQINSFFFGDFFEVNTQSSVLYPVLLLEAKSSKISVRGNAFSLTLDVAIFDLVQKDADEVEVLSDTHLIFVDLLSKIKEASYSRIFDFEEDIVLRAFRERFNDVVSGWQSSLTFVFTHDFQFCDLPMI